jgi:hypothetical protein
MTEFTAPTVDEYHEQIEQSWSRNKISRRTALKGALVGAGAIALINFPVLKRAFAASGGTSGLSGAILVGRHIGFINSGTDDPTNAMAVSAQVIFPNGVQSSGVTPTARYGTTPAYGSVAAATIVNLLGVVPNAPQGTLAGNQFYFKTAFTGLQPNTTYHYQLVLSDGTTTADGTFTTAPDRRGLGLTPTAGVPIPPPFTFTSFGDHGTNGAPTDPAWAYANNSPFTWPTASFDDNYYAANDPVLSYDPTPAITMTGLVAAQSPRFHLMNGDVCYADPSGTGLPVDDSSASGTHGGAPAGKNAYNPYVWDVYLAQIEAVASAVPWMVSTGNHDMEAVYGTHGYGGHVARLDMPQNGPGGCPSVYSFVYANVGVISVDANDLSFELATNLNYSGGAQYNWVESTLAGWRCDPTIDFIVMFMHHCAFATSVAHASDQGVRNLVAVLADRYQVDVVLSGHNHQVERTNPIRNNVSAMQAPDGTSFDPSVGTTYVTVGSAGRPRYGWYNGGTVDSTGTTDRYRGHMTGAGASTTVVNRIYTAPGNPATGIAAATTPETIEWSQTRYLDYALARFDVTPAAAGSATTLSLFIVADGDRVSTAGGVVVDQVDLVRTAGAATGTCAPPTDVPEASSPVLLAVGAGAVVLGAAALARHRPGSDRASTPA